MLIDFDFIPEIDNPRKEGVENQNAWENNEYSKKYITLFHSLFVNYPLDKIGREYENK